MKEKVNFPGYDEQQEEKSRLHEAQEREKVARKATREEKRKNKIPAFLVIRGGALNTLIVGLIGAAGLTAILINRYCIKKELLAPLLLLASCMTAVGLGLTPRVGENKIDEIKRVMEFVNGQTDKYLQNKGILDMRATKMRLMVLPYVVKQKPGIFDTFIKYPKSVTDMKIAESILSTYLKSHPDYAQKILDTFNEESLPKKLYRRANRYATRLKRLEERTR